MISSDVCSCLRWFDCPGLIRGPSPVPHLSLLRTVICNCRASTCIYVCARPASCLSKLSVGATRCAIYSRSSSSARLACREESGASADRPLVRNGRLLLDPGEGKNLSCQDARLPESPVLPTETTFPTQECKWLKAPAAMPLLATSQLSPSPAKAGRQWSSSLQRWWSDGFLHE